ncbi:MAG: CdaR family protein, partial [Kurthia sp.]
MDKYVDHPWVLRITALALAVLMFFSVKPSGTANQNESTTSGTKDAILQEVPVELRYDDSNFVVTGVPQTVNVKITGPIGIVITTQNSRNAKVIVNVKDKPSGEHIVKFEPEGLSDKLIAEVEPKTVKVMVEERITKDVKVEPEINENQLADGKYVKSMTTEPTMVTVSG